MDAPDPNLVTSGKGAAFHKAHPRYGGRAKGTPNKTTRNIRDAMTESAVKHGIDGEGTGGLTGFCQWLLKNDLKAWCHIFGRLVPLQVAAELDHRGGIMQVNVIGVPHGVHFSKEQVEQISNAESDIMPVIEAAISATVIEASAKLVEGDIVSEGNNVVVTEGNNSAPRSDASDEEVRKEEVRTTAPRPADANVVVIRSGPPRPRRFPPGWPGPRD